jgi:opacity protein-like surface antigen
MNAIRLFASRPRCLRSGFASLVLSAVLAAPALAQDCTSEPVADGLSFDPCDTDAATIDWNSGVSVPPGGGDSRDAVPWIARNTSDVPATLSPSDTGVSVRTSLGTVRDYNARWAAPTIVQPEDGTTVSLDIPKGASAPKTPWDVWTNVDLEGYNSGTSQSSRTGLGVDYKYNPATTFGVSVERGDARASGTPGSQEDQKASAYVSLQAMPMLSLDARTEWQSGNSEFAAAAGTNERSAVILAPKINHSFTLDNGNTLSPYLTYQREFDVTSGRKEGIDPSFGAERSAGAGVTYSKTDSYSLSVSADVDNFGVTDEAQSLSSKFQLSVPFGK